MCIIAACTRRVYAQSCSYSLITICHSGSFKFSPNIARVDPSRRTVPAHFRTVCSHPFLREIATLCVMKCSAASPCALCSGTPISHQKIRDTPHAMGRLCTITPSQPSSDSPAVPHWHLSMHSEVLSVRAVCHCHTDDAAILSRFVTLILASGV